LNIPELLNENAILREKLAAAESEKADTDLAFNHANEVIEKLDADLDTAKAALLSAQKEIERLREALQEIAEPIPFMRKRAEAEGAKINGPMAVALAGDHQFLKSVARAALAQAEGKETK
jgi:chromosome segregation ATPase